MAFAFISTIIWGFLLFVDVRAIRKGDVYEYDLHDYSGAADPPDDEDEIDQYGYDNTENYDMAAPYHLETDS